MSGFQYPPMGSTPARQCCIISIRQDRPGVAARGAGGRNSTQGAILTFPVLANPASLRGMRRSAGLDESGVQPKDYSHDETIQTQNGQGRRH